MLRIRATSRQTRVGMALVAVLAGVVLTRAAVGPAVAHYHSSGVASAAALEAALDWDGTDPTLHRRLAMLQQGRLVTPDLEGAERHLRATLSRRPTDAAAWLGLALLLDRRGDRSRARDALDAALRVDGHNGPVRWEAALLELRWNRSQAALAHFRELLIGDPVMRLPAYRLTRSLFPRSEQVADLIPTEVAPLTGMLEFAINYHDVPLAELFWERRATLEPPISAPLLRRYVELLLVEGRGAPARRLWPRVVPAGYRDTPGDLIWNGGFEAPSLLGWGFDWLVTGAETGEVVLDRDVVASGSQSLRVSFRSSPTDSGPRVFQNVVVEPGRAYRLRALVKGADFVGDPGVRLELAPAQGGPTLGTTAIALGNGAWVPAELRVIIPPSVTRVHVRLRRDRSSELAGMLGGRIWLDDVSLVEIGRKGA